MDPSFITSNTNLQQHTTSIVLSSHKSNATPSDSTLSLHPHIHIPQPKEEAMEGRKESNAPHSLPELSEKERKREERRKKREAKDKERQAREERSKRREKGTLLHLLSKDVLQFVCSHLSFVDMFTCTRVCKRLGKKVSRMLSNHKQCNTVENADIELLLNPTLIADGVIFYRTPCAPPDTGFKKLNMEPMRTINKAGVLHHTTRVCNSVQHYDYGQTAYHLKQLEHMVVYNTVNGNEIVRVANSWIFFNEKLFIKISDKEMECNLDGASLSEEDETQYLVDIILVEANLQRNQKPTGFLWRSKPAFVEPFCEITLDNLHMRTSVVSREADPVWNEDCSFTIWGKTSNNLQIAMLDQGKLGRHTKLGMVEVLLKNLACDVLHDVWQPIQSLDDSLSGQFHILIHKTEVPKKDEVDTRGLGILGHNGPMCESVPLRLEFGDIILISNSEFYTHIAKLGTMSLWDHIAMVVEREGELHLFESTPDGVFTVPLNRRLKFYLKSSTLGVRRLTLTRTPEMKKSLENFIEEVDGRPYKQNWMDLVRAWQGSHTNEDLSSIFCSELMAAAYKRMGLLDNSIPSNNFLPVDFAFPNNQKVKLTKGKLEKIRMVYNTKT